jgi:hypothetical protein
MTVVPTDADNDKPATIQLAIGKAWCLWQASVVHELAGGKDTRRSIHTVRDISADILAEVGFGDGPGRLARRVERASQHLDTAVSVAANTCVKLAQAIVDKGLLERDDNGPHIRRQKQLRATLPPIMMQLVADARAAWRPEMGHILQELNENRPSWVGADGVEQAELAANLQAIDRYLRYIGLRVGRLSTRPSSAELSMSTI